MLDILCFEKYMYLCKQILGIKNGHNLSEEATEDIEDISDFIIAVSRPSHAERYTFEMLSELKALSHIATMLPEPEYEYPKRFHPNAKMMKLHKKPLCAIFHIEDKNVIIDRIVHSSMITHFNSRCDVPARFFIMTVDSANPSEKKAQKKPHGSFEVECGGGEHNVDFVGQNV